MKTVRLLFFQIFMSNILYLLLALNCLNDSNHFYCKLGTRTPYRFIANYNDSQLNFPGCKEKKIWLMIRHGTRFPGKKQIKLMRNNLPILQKKIIKNLKTNKPNLFHDFIKKFNKWKLRFNESRSMYLADEGKNELIDLAERIQTRFPTLFLENYSENLYQFKYTATERTESSAKSFVLGLFGQFQNKNISFPKPQYKDPILRFYKNCERWRTEIDKNLETHREKDLFLKSVIFRKTLSEVSKQIGYKLNHEILRLIYIMCGFETAWNEFEKSPWCDLLSYNNIKVLEFVEDLEYYWVDGYGYHLNYEQACLALLDMFKFFESSEKTLVTAYFTHSGAILKILSILGVAKDENPLIHTSFSLNEDLRHWKVSLIDAFASNIAFILYDCKIQGPRILILHQERPFYIQGCPFKALCPILLMKKILPDTEQKCQFNAMCSMKSN